MGLRKLDGIVPITKEGDFNYIQYHELKYSIKSLKVIRTSLAILVFMMIAFAMFVTIWFYNSLNSFQNISVEIQIVGLWAFPIVIYIYFTWIYMERSKYSVKILPKVLVYTRLSSSITYYHSDIVQALKSKPLIRDRQGVWLPTLTNSSILLAETDTLPGKPFIEDLLRFYGTQVPKDPYGTDRNTFSSIGLVLIFLVSPIFIYMGFINKNANALSYSIYITFFICFIGLIFLVISSHSTKLYKDHLTDEETELDDPDYMYEEALDLEMLNNEDNIQNRKKSKKYLKFNKPKF